ncbi:FAD:protein FMN transferase [Mesonia aestuariivivens]|uniref:FAD:protein FMN transferase n=1 Tax=Mesonia aestuariivivens TaxID=2796128 RepID=A0ABS6VZB4_9FLAO|nr:FAD:protein FMN transferase [Mesonia aestuariivivens]MBW2960936.1 FAD:protein FMN transferase [Mesonia aestuariivivens]
MKNILIVLSILFLTACQQKNNKKFFQGDALGTTYHITFFSDNELNWDKGLDSIFEHVNKSLSTYLPNSDISKINKGDTTVQVDEMFKDVFLLSKDIFKSTDGYFDPTVGNLVNAYGFGAENLNHITAKKLDSLFSLVGFQNYKLTPDNRIEKQLANSYLEFNSIAKGYTVDRLAVYLENNGVNNYLVELGGELRVNGKNTDRNQAWRVGLDNPYQDELNREIIAVLEMKNQGLATSGNYRKFRVDSLTGEKFVHTINPKTGKAEKSNVLSASVLAKTCGEADAYATAFMAMGIDKAKEVLENEKAIDAYLIFTENDSTKVFVTNNFQKQLMPN